MREDAGEEQQDSSNQLHGSRQLTHPAQLRAQIHGRLYIIAGTGSGSIESRQTDWTSLDCDGSNKKLGAVDISMG